MTRYHWMRPCPRCDGQGRLLILKNRGTGTLYLHCEECEWGWGDPALAAAGDIDAAFLTLQEDFESDTPSLDEIGRLGWGKFVAGYFDE